MQGPSAARVRSARSSLEVLLREIATSIIDRSLNAPLGTIGRSLARTLSIGTPTSPMMMWKSAPDGKLFDLK